MKRLTITLAAALALFASTAAAPAPALAQDNAAIAINTEDGASVFELAFDVQRVMNGVVDQQNVAVAYASCADCQTVAIAIQIVLVMSDPTVITPENYAIALNEGCDTCATLASAYQFVFGAPEGFEFSEHAWERILGIKE